MPNNLVDAVPLYFVLTHAHIAYVCCGNIKVGRQRAHLGFWLACIGLGFRIYKYSQVFGWLAWV